MSASNRPAFNSSFTTIHRAVSRMASIFLVLSVLIVAAPSTARAGTGDLPGPADSAKFGAKLSLLPNGNFVVSDPEFSPGSQVKIGAVYLYNGTTHAQISRMTGATDNDGVGTGGIIILEDGNFVVSSPRWNNGSVTLAGAVTWCSATTGCPATVSSSNSIVGSHTDDHIAASYLDTTGLSDSNNIDTLPGGKYVVATYLWNSGRGAATFCAANGACTGAVSSANSLVGVVAAGASPGEYGDGVGTAVTVLSDGSYVVRSTWGNGVLGDNLATLTLCPATGCTGTLSTANSLRGSAKWDQIAGQVYPLAGGAFVAVSYSVDVGGADGAGAVTYCASVSDPNCYGQAVSAANSLAGNIYNQSVGSGQVTVLSNGDYLVGSPQWYTATMMMRNGASTYCTVSAGASDCTGKIVSAANSLTGDQNDTIGSVNVALPNGAYVVNSNQWHSYRGSSTFCSNKAACMGKIVSAANSLVGTLPGDASHGDQVSNAGTTVLSDGGYLIGSRNWNDGLGAVTYCPPTGCTGTVTAENSLTGSQPGDAVGSGEDKELPGGAVIIGSSDWINGSTPMAGAVTYCSSPAACMGETVNYSNSLVGDQDKTSMGGNLMNPLVLSNGAYLVSSYFWDYGAESMAGALTWCPPTGCTGMTIGEANSLVGSHANDSVGGSVEEIADDLYVTQAGGWQNGPLVGAGAVTLCSVSTGCSGLITSTNSVLGGVASEGYAYQTYKYDSARHQLMVGMPLENKVVFFALPTAEPSISGNAGIAAASLDYIDDTPQTATADGSGVYSFTLPSGWSGTVTPTLAGYSFTPTHRAYTNVTGALADQDYRVSACTPPGSGTVNWSVAFGTCPAGAKFIIPSGLNVVLDSDISISADLEVQSGGTLDPNAKTVTLSGDTNQTLSGNPLTFYRLTINKADAGDTVTIVGKLKVTKKLTVSKGKLISASDYEDVEIEEYGELELTSDISVSGHFTNSGSLTTNGHRITFDGGVEQNLTLNVFTSFDDVTVGAGTTLIETVSDDNALVGGLTNYGVIRKTQPVSEEESYYFGLAGRYAGADIEIDVTGQGTLSALQVDRVDANPPGDPGATTDVYWHITPTGGGYTARLSLPHDELSNPTACRRVSGSSWDCARSEFDESLVTRAGVTAFSDWAVFEFQPTTLTLSTSDNPAQVRSPVAFTATVEPAAAPGNVQFYVDGAALGESLALVDGAASITTTTLAVGSHVITAAYTGATLFDAAAGRLSPDQQIDCAPALTVFNAADSGAGSLRQALADVCPDGSIDFGADSAITLASELTITKNLRISGAGRAVTVSGNQAVRVFNIQSGNVSFSDLTIQNGYVIEASGGGIYASGALTLTNVNVLSNTAMGGDGGGGVRVQGPLLVTGGRFENNVAPDTGEGGAIRSSAMSPQPIANISGTVFISNTSSYGGGVSLAGVTWMTDTTFLSNTATSSGGGAWIYNALTLSGGRFEGNTAALQGGGARIRNGVALTGTQFIGNAAENGGGLFGNGVVTVSRAVFENNTAIDSSGGGLYSALTLAVTDTKFIGNRAANGGGAYVNGGNPAGTSSVVNVLLQANSASTDGAALYLYSTSGRGGSATILHTTIASPTVDGGQAIYVGKPGAYPVTTTIINSIVASYTTGISFAAGVVVDSDYNLFHNAPTAANIGDHSIAGVDPLFADPAGGDYHLRRGSAAIDAGTNAGVTTDLDGNARPLDLGFDIGAYESPYVLLHNLDARTAGTGEGTVTSEPAGLDCGVTCAASFDHNTVVTLTAQPEVDSTFTGWSGAVVDTVNTVVLTMDDAKSVTATFDVKTYIITPTAGTNGAITPDVPQTVDYGASATFTVTPDAHYHVADVGVDGVSVGAVTSYTFEDVTAGHTITAVFAIDTVALTIATDGAGIVDNEPDDATYDATYAYGTVVTLTATPDPGSAFVSWSGDASGTANPLLLTLDVDMAVTATFALNSYTITPTAGAHGSITPGTPQSVDYGASTTFTITPDAHYHVADVGVDGVSVGAVSDYTFEKVKASHSITAAFAIDTVALTIATNGTGAGAVASEPDGTMYAFGTVVTLTATPLISSTFTGWSGACAGSAACVVTMIGDKTVTATFTLKTYTITPAAGAHGSITPDSAQTISYGASATFSISPDLGYHIADVAVDGVSVGAVDGYTFNAITASHTISAAFAATEVITIAHLALTAQPGSLYANGLDRSTLTISATTENGDGAPFAGRVVLVTTSGLGSLSAAKVKLGPNGVATTTYTAGYSAGIETIHAQTPDRGYMHVATATLQLKPNPLAARLTVNFVGAAVTYTLVVTNTGLDLHSVVISGSAPANSVLVAVTGGIATMSGGDYGAGYASVGPFDLAASQQHTLVWTVRMTTLSGDVRTRAHAYDAQTQWSVEVSSQFYRVWLPLFWNNTTP